MFRNNFKKKYLNKKLRALLRYSQFLRDVTSFPVLPDDMDASRVQPIKLARVRK